VLNRRVQTVALAVGLDDQAHRGGRHPAVTHVAVRVDYPPHGTALDARRGQPALQPPRRARHLGGDAEPFTPPELQSDEDADRWLRSQL
jgi:hypothetical protein